MENYYVRILTKNMRNVYVEAHRRAMKEYYPPHLTGPGSRGVGLLDMVFFGQGIFILLGKGKGGRAKDGNRLPGTMRHVVTS